MRFCLKGQSLTAWKACILRKAAKNKDISDSMDMELQENSNYIEAKQRGVFPSFSGSFLILDFSVP